MESLNPNLVTALIGGVCLVLLCVGAYVWLCVRTLRNGGKVYTEPFGLPDLMASILLYTWLLVAIVNGFGRPGRRDVQTDDVIRGAAMFLIIVMGLWLFMRVRSISVTRLFGVKLLSGPATFGYAVGLLLLALPIVFASMGLMRLLLGPEARSQELVEFFRQSASRSNKTAVISTMTLGVVVAPFAEEFIFRGYLYGVFKRYVGITGGTVLSAIVFAALHLNAASLPALFILAVCLTLAYETTGSILVSMCMHSMFNLMAFVAMLVAPNLAQ